MSALGPHPQLFPLYLIRPTSATLTCYLLLFLKEARHASAPDTGRRGMFGENVTLQRPSQVLEKESKLRNWAEVSLKRSVYVWKRRRKDRPSAVAVPAVAQWAKNQPTEPVSL